MPRVICIDGKSKFPGIVPNIPEGVEYVAYQSCRYEDCWVIDEYRYTNDGNEVHHTKSRFIELSDLDETILVNTKEEYA